MLNFLFIVNLFSELVVAPLCLLIFHAIVWDFLLKYKVISVVTWAEFSGVDDNKSVLSNDAGPANWFGTVTEIHR